MSLNLEEAIARIDAADKITLRDKYGPAMEIDNSADAARYFDACVRHMMRVKPCERDEAERIERGNLGYYAGYYDEETRAQVERAFDCSHPIFGKLAEVGAPSLQEAVALGEARGEQDA